MATKTTIRQGSSGSAVKEWQNYLKSQGYDIGSTGADGIFGSKTLAATKQYQKDKGLAVDGIVGSKTWGSMTSTGKTTSSTTPKITTYTTSDTTNKFKETSEQKQAEMEELGTFTYDDYVQSDSVTAAYDKLNSLQEPGEYQSKWQTDLDDTINKILNREEFSYDLNGDALYQQYKDQYINQGKLASQDVMGQAAAMTGGYGNSYVQTVGQQTYQGYLQQLNDKVPELYQLALDKYNSEGQDLYNQYGLLSDRENQDYGRYRDAKSDYFTERDYWTNQYNTERDWDYSKYLNEQDQKFNEWNTNYDVLNDAINRADSNYWNSYDADYTQFSDNRSLAYDTAIAMLNLGEMPSAELLSAAGISSADAQKIVSAVEEKESSGSYGAGGGTYSNGRSGYNNGNVSASNIKLIQEALGVSADGKWGSQSSSAAGGMTADEAWEAYQNGTLVSNNDGLNADDYKDWDALDWESYFATIRNTDGVDAAVKELQEFTSKGIIPTKMVIYASIGARGKLGHKAIIWRFSYGQ